MDLENTYKKVTSFRSPCNSKFCQDSMKIQRKKAIENIKKSEHFIVITQSKLEGLEDSLGILATFLPQPTESMAAVDVPHLPVMVKAVESVHEHLIAEMESFIEEVKKN